MWSESDPGSLAEGSHSESSTPTCKKAKGCGETNGNHSHGHCLSGHGERTGVGETMVGVCTTSTAKALLCDVNTNSKILHTSNSAGSYAFLYQHIKPVSIPGESWLAQTEAQQHLVPHGVFCPEPRLALLRKQQDGDDGIH